MPKKNCFQCGKPISNRWKDGLPMSKKQWKKRKFCNWECRKKNIANPCLSYPIQEVVYVIGTIHNMYKIGKTGNLVERFSTIRTGCPFPLSISHIFVTTDSHNLELQLHQYFVSKRKQGEWFELDQNDIIYLDQLQTAYS